MATVERPEQGKVIIFDKPGSPQSLILAGHVAPPTNAPNAIAINAMNDILGGQFTARVNMNLREDKGWAYGAYTFLQGRAWSTAHILYTRPVQTDRTVDSVRELIKELNDVQIDETGNRNGARARCPVSNTRSLPGAFETSGDVLGSLVSSSRYGRPWNYPETLKGKYEALSEAEIAAAAAAEVVHPESLVWVIVGDREKIEAGLQALDLGPVETRTLD